jgi:hypothetical protein
LRFPFAFSRLNECYRDITPTILMLFPVSLTTHPEPARWSIAPCPPDTIPAN